MSLLIHLPLTKDLRNQGLATITSTGTPVFKNIGKIGSKSLDLNTRINFNCTALANVQTFSIAFWAKTNQDSNITGDWMDVLGFTDISSSGSSGQLRWETCYTYGAPTRGISAHDNATYATVQGPSGQASIKGNWNHFCITVDPLGTGRAVEYQDGVKIGDYAANGGHLTGSFWTGETNKVNGEIQDIRIYNHALSQMEVKELSKGLVLHYPLSRNGWGQENLVTGSNTNSSSNAWGHSNASGSVTRSIVIEDGIPCVKLTRGSDAQSSWHYFYYSNLLRNQIKTNTTYTISFDLKPSVNGSVSFSAFMNGNATNSMSASVTTLQGNLIANEWNHCIMRTTTKSSFDDITVGSQLVYMSVSASLRAADTWTMMKNIKVEEGSIATPWCPNSSDALASAMGLNDNIEYDISGFRNNGTRTGTFTYSSDTPKYQVSTKFSDGSYIKYKGPESMYQATYAFWVKSDSYTAYNMIHGPLGSPSAGTSPWLSANTESCGAWAYFGNNSPNYTRASGTISTDVWHHLVYVWDNGVARWYVDGVPSGNAVTYTTRTFIQNTAESSIGDSYTGTSWSGTPFTGQLSDFRIYATALSPEDVLSLYQASAYIDS